MPNPYTGISELEQLPPWDGKRFSPIEVPQQILAALNNPQDRLRTVHIAGTNGKGSVCSYIAACLWAQGNRVGQFASPHLSHVTERCIIDGKPAALEDFDRSVRKVFEVLKDLQLETSYFVVGMIATFLQFVEKDVDWAVIEVGLGGRFDATNLIARPRASVITRIGFDHMHILGEKLEVIADSKAGIIKPGVPAFVGANAAAALDVCVAEAARAGAPIECLGRDFNYWDDTRTVVWSGGKFTFPADLPLLSIPARVENAVLAVRTAASLGCSGAAIEKGLRACRWPGRMETFSVDRAGKPPAAVLIDGMHNIDGAQVLLQFLRSFLSANRRYQHLSIVFAMRRNKQWMEVLDLLKAGIAGIEVGAQGGRSPEIEWIFTGANLSNMVDPGEMAWAVTDASGNAVSIAEVHPALDYALERADESTLVVVAGSLYLLGELRPRLAQQPFCTIAVN